MFVFLFLLWVIFNGRWTTEIALIGLAVAALVYAFTCKFIGLSPRKEWQALCKIPKAIAYVVYLAREIINANLQVLHLIYSPKMVVEPQLKDFSTKLRNDGTKATLPNSITLTPGTITVNVKDDTYLVHCLDSSMAEGLENSGFEQRLLEMEGK